MATHGGTIPLLLWDYEKQLKKGDNLILAAFGADLHGGQFTLSGPITVNCPLPEQEEICVEQTGDCIVNSCN